MSKLQDKLYEVLKGNDWMSRAQIASAINRKTGTLTNYDIQLLDNLVNTGKIQQRVATVGAVKERYEYKAT